MAHEYMHSLPREEEEIINNMLREWKREHSKECKIEFVDELDLGFEVKAIEFNLDKILTKEKREEQRELHRDLLEEMRF